MTDTEAHQSTLRAITEELQRLEARRQQLLAAQEVVRGFTIGQALTAGDFQEAVAAAGTPSVARVGPSNAVLMALTDIGHPASRREVIARALDFVNTPPERAKKVLDQTIRNMVQSKKLRYVDEDGEPLLVAA